MPEGRIAKLWAELGLRSTLARDLNREVSSAQGAARRGSQGLIRNLGGAEQVGRTMTRTVTLPLLAVGGAAIKSSVDFESAFAGVRKTVDATEPEFAALRKGILDMTKTLPASKEEIAGVSEAAGQLGIQNRNILGFTRTMIDLGESTNLSANEAATALARLANITGLPQTEFDRLGSTIVELGNNLATTEAEITQMGLRLAGAGKQVGLTEAQILSLAGGLSSVGVEAQAGGTAISRAFLQMQRDVLDGGKQLDKFAAVAGTSSRDFAQAFKRDAAGAMITFIEGLERLRRQGVPVASVLDDLKLGEIRVRDALMRAAGAGDLFRKSMQIGSAAWEENNALTEEANKRYATTESRLKILRNRVTAAAIPLGEALVPALTQIAGVVATVAEGFAALPGPVRTAVIVLGGVAVVAGPLLRVAAAFAKLRAAMAITTAASAAVSGAGAAGGAAAAGGGLAGVAGKASMLAPALGPAIAVVGGLAAGFVIARQKIDQVSPSLDRFREATGEVAAAEKTLAARQAESRAAQRRLNQLRSDGTASTRELRGAVRQLADAETARFDAFRERAAAEREQLGALTDAIANVFPSGADKFVLRFRDALQAGDETTQQFNANIRKIAEASRDLPFAAVAQQVRAAFPDDTARQQRVIAALRDQRQALTQLDRAARQASKAMGTQVSAVNANTAAWGQQKTILAGTAEAFARGETGQRRMRDALKETVVVALENNLAFAKQEAQQGRSVDAIRATIRTLEAMQDEFPPLAGMIQRHIDKLKGIPPRARTKVTADISQAQSAIASFKGLLGTIPAEVTVSGSFAGRIVGGLLGVEGAQHGGRFGTRDVAVVGEAGPEIAKGIPGGGFEVFPNRVLRALNAMPAGGAAAGGDGAEAPLLGSLTINNPKPEPSSQSLPRALRRMRLEANRR